jgi:hypothetical protein
MDLLSLYAGLLLPWICGAVWLIFVERYIQPSITPNLFRQIGYGFFLGYAGLFIAIMICHLTMAAVYWPGIMVFLLLIALTGSFMIWRTPVSNTAIATHPTQSNSQNRSLAMKLLLAVLLLWTGIHLLIYTIDVYTQPVYPWDAWLAWVYRAKAWFLAGGITPVVSAADWASSGSTATYTIDAWMYPIFPSIVPFWAALSLGHWSETLVNVPVLFAGLAIGMALYGQCREFGLGLLSSVVCIYLLYSIPLLGIHIGLAGYADIWMAGFTGLGFVALIRALALRLTPGSTGYGLQITLAFMFLVFSIFVKNEGAVWLMLGLILLMFLSYRARVPIMISVCIAMLLLIGFALGITQIDLPWIGPLGLQDGRLMIPFIGNFALEIHSIWYSYLTNFFSLGSWNLFWVLVLTALILAIPSNANLVAQKVQRIGLTFIVLFLATQFFIFGLTDQGIWADAFTAINRLPLHFVPALLFASFAILHARMSNTDHVND